MKNLLDFLLEMMSALAMTSSSYMESQHLYYAVDQDRDAEKEGE